MIMSFSSRAIVPMFVSILALSISFGYVVFLAPYEVIRTVARMDLHWLAGVCGAVAVSVGLGGLRLAMLLRHSGYQIGLRDSVWVVSASQLASTLFIQIVAQIGSRSLLLARLGVPVETTVLVTIVERGLGLLLRKRLMNDF
jgi:hypothetical protein